MKVFTAQQMRDFDKSAIEDYGIPSIVLMENAALRVVEFLEAKFAPLSQKKIVILCGKGNNGGDGLAIARHLTKVLVGSLRVIQIFETDELKGDARQNTEMLDLALQNDKSVYQRRFSCIAGRSYSGTFWEKSAEEKPESFMAPSQVHRASVVVSEADIVLDCILGTGFSAPIRGARIKAALSIVNQHIYGHLISVDIPSGFDSDKGLNASLYEADDDTDGDWLEEGRLDKSSDFTLTFVGAKRGFFVKDGIKKCGEVWVGDVGAPLILQRTIETGVQALNLETAKQLLPHRQLDAHKGDAGRALIVGGSFGMSGSICLASKAALAIGAGLVEAALPRDVLPIFAGAVLEAVSHPLPNDESGHLCSHAADDVAALWDKAQVVALGPGLGRTPEAFEFARRVARECPVPLVIDADALHALPAIVDDVKARRAPTILTPHPGEMGVLMDSDAKTVNDARFETVAACAQKYGAIVVLKGARTLVCDSSGEIWVNLTGHPGMATGGAGDVLTGTIAGLLAQLKDADSAAKLGVYVHGLAGEIAARTRGNGLVAGDIAAHLPAALLEIKAREVERINGRLRKLE